MTKKKKIIIWLVVILLGFIIMSANTLLTNLTENTNVVCKGEKFSSAEEALKAYEASEREANDESLDYCPPYELLYEFDYDENTIIFYSYCETFDGEKSQECAVRILKKNSNGTLSFDSGFADFVLAEPSREDNYCYFTNIETDDGMKSISFLYLPKDSKKDIYVDGVKAEKVLVKVEGEEFYICYAISDPDTFFSNFSTEISDRHEVEVR